MKTKLILTVSACAIIIGCGTPVARQSATANNSKFVALGTLGARTVRCTAMQETQLPDGRMQVRANILNLINKRVDLQISCAFKDEQGFAIDTTPFQTLILDETAQETVEFISLNAKAKDYTVRVRLAR
jgi:hypothetical protein